MRLIELDDLVSVARQPMVQLIYPHRLLLIDREEISQRRGENDAKRLS